MQHHDNNPPHRNAQWRLLRLGHCAWLVIALWTACVAASASWGIYREFHCARDIALSHGGLWLLGLLGIAIGMRHIRRCAAERKRAEEDLKRMEAQLAHVARLSLMGEMAAGIAHEVNQPLVTILNYAKACRNILVGETSSRIEDLRKWNDEIATSAAHAGEIVKRLKGFARKTEVERIAVNINHIVQEAVQLVAFETRRGMVDIRLELCEAPPAIEADRVQILQVLVNLMYNALEAMEQHIETGRRLTIRTKSAGKLLEVSVADNGPGFSHSASLNIFDPFVTTKPQGLGMGLAISRTIIEAHGGKLWAESNSHGGATLRFTLPIREGDESDGD